MRMDDRETATVLVALRNLQKRIERMDDDMAYRAMFDGDIIPLSIDEIDNLCERVNLDE